jgi:hypothetical protein
MVASIHTADKSLRAYGGHFLTGNYSPARRTAALPIIPARTSAYPAAVVNVRSRHTRLASEEASQDLTCIPTMPQPRAIWQYETLHYVAESSLATLSLALTDTDAKSTTLAEAPVLTSATAHRRSGALRRDHSIIERLHQHDVADVDTVPPLVSHAFGVGTKHAFSFHPIDHLRWWLLQPGRLEFLMWLAGTIFLIGVSILLCLLLLSSLGYLVIH